MLEKEYRTIFSKYETVSKGQEPIEDIFYD